MLQWSARLWVAAKTQETAQMLELFMITGLIAAIGLILIGIGICRGEHRYHR
jgi:hypothetical protein